VSVHGRSLVYSCQWNVAPQQNTNVNSMQENKHGKHAQTEPTRRHGQGTCRQVPGMSARRARTPGARKQGTDTRTQRALSTLGFVNVGLCQRQLCCRLCLWNMHTAQDKSRTGGLCVDHLGYGLLSQIGSRCASALCLSLSCLTTVVDFY